MDNTSIGILGLVMGSFVFVIGWYVLILAARWRVFTKAGLAGWKSLIPIYSEYCTFKISWKTMFFWIVIAAGIVSGMLTNMMDGQETVSALVRLLASAAGVTVTIINLVMNIKLSQRFGHGILFGLGLMFLTPVFTLILGLGDSEYLGNPDEGMPSKRVYFA